MCVVVFVTKSVVKGAKSAFRTYIESRVLNALLCAAFLAAKVARLLASELDEEKY